MSASVITLAFENWKAQEAASGKPVSLNEFVFANVPNLDINKPIDRNEKLPAAAQIVHRQAVNQTGLASANAVAYSVTLGAEIGNFDFNWIGLLNKESGTVAMITHAPTQKKLKTQSGQQGNVLTRSFLLEFNGAAQETQISTRAETWQIDFTARLMGIDEIQRLTNLDTYGFASFIGNGFQVTRNAEQYTVHSGTGYIGGLRGELDKNLILNSLRNTKIFADFSYQGTVTSQFKAVVKITAITTQTNYVDAAGFSHYVFAVASVDGSGVITDLRPKGTLGEQLIKNEYQLKGDYATNKNLGDGLDKKFDKIGGGVKGDIIADGNIQSNTGRVGSILDKGVGSQLDSTGAIALLRTRNKAGTWFEHRVPEKAGTLMQVGDFGFGGSAENNWLASRDDIETALKTMTTPSQYWRNGTSSDITTAYAANSYVSVGDCWFNLSVSYGDGLVRVSSGNRNNFNLSTLYSTRNARVDRNGHLKITGSSDDLSDCVVGVPLPWAQSSAPTGYLLCNGQTFNKVSYPLLAKAYPSGILPDLRGEFIRGLDAGRGVDSGRTLLSAQGDATRKITGTFSGSDDNKLTPAVTLSGAFYDTGKNQGTDAGGDSAQPIIGFDSSRVVPTANENRPRNIAFLYIVRAA